MIFTENQSSFSTFGVIFSIVSGIPLYIIVINMFQQYLHFYTVSLTSTKDVIYLIRTIFTQLYVIFLFFALLFIDIRCWKKIHNKYFYIVDILPTSERKKSFTNFVLVAYMLFLLHLILQIMYSGYKLYMVSVPPHLSGCYFLLRIYNIMLLGIIYGLIFKNVYKEIYIHLENTVDDQWMNWEYFNKELLKISIMHRLMKEIIDEFYNIYSWKLFLQISLNVLELTSEMDVFLSGIKILDKYNHAFSSNLYTGLVSITMVT